MQKIQIHGIPAIIFGDTSNKLCLYIHGQGGNKEEAQDIAEMICGYHYQVLSIDLPEHGERVNESNSFDPWHIVPELSMVMKDVKQNWEQITLIANSIGAWFSMQSFDKECLNHCLFISPVLDMTKLMSKMMGWANVSEEQLKKELVIPTTFGQTLSWKYWEYIQSHPITKWEVPTKILYGGNDHLIDRDVVEQFAHRFHCGLDVMENGEHWFHTDEQLKVMHEWLMENLKL